MKSFVFAILLALTSCQSVDTQALQATEYACASAAAALKTAIVFNDKLSPATRTKVTQAVAITDPICSQETTPTLTSTARAALNGALTTLNSAAAEASK